MRIVVTEPHETALSVQAATALLGIQERILRRAAGCTSRAEALMGISGELAQLLPARYCWLERAEAGQLVAYVTAVTPQDDLTWRLLGSAEPVEGHWVPPAGRAAAVSLHSDWIPSDARFEAVTALGVRECAKVCFSYASGDLGAVVLGFAESPPAEAAELLHLLSSCIVAALHAPAAPSAACDPPRLAAVDSVELVDYVARALAHDVRNIMSGIIGAIELQRASMDESNAPIFDVVRRRSVEGVAMVDAMRERLTRIGCGRQVPVDMAVVAEDVVACVQAAVATTYGDRAPRITLEAERAWVVCVPAELRRAAVALLFNAVRAAGPGGEVLVRTGVERRHCVMQFSDSGAALPQDHCRRVKEPFYTTEERGHPGLGLTIADGVARSSGGSVSAKLAETGGMTAALMLPAADIGDLPA